MKKKIRFILNPHSGTAKKHDIPDRVKKLIDSKKYEFDIVVTEGPKHATTLSQEAAQKNYDVVASIGGDGSANEVAAGLNESETALAFIAMGSGNGMSRFLKIPMNLDKALHVINTGIIDKIDTVRVNDAFCLGTIGVGFDAHVAHLFAKAPKRGLSTYAKLVMSEFSKYKPLTYDIVIDDKIYSEECFLLTFANSNQFGNNAIIAPFADVRDGIMDISLIKKFPLIAAPSLVWRLMNSSIHHSKFFSMMKGKNIVLKNNGKLKAHIDGEPITFVNDISIQVVPHSLNVVVPAN